MNACFCTQCLIYKTISKIQLNSTTRQNFGHDFVMKIKPIPCVQFYLSLACILCETFIKPFHIKVDYIGRKYFFICGKMALAPSPAMKKKQSPFNERFLYCCSIVFDFVKFGQLNQLNESYKTKDRRTLKKSAYAKRKQLIWYFKSFVF